MRSRSAFSARTASCSRLAREAAITDIERFQADMASDQARNAMQKDQEEGYVLGVTSTPAFLVNDRPILGAQPTATFEEAVETAAKAAGR